MGQGISKTNNNNNYTQTTSFNHLSKEVKLNIFSYLPDHELRSYRLVSKQANLEACTLLCIKKKHIRENVDAFAQELKKNPGSRKECIQELEHLLQGLKSQIGVTRLDVMDEVSTIHSIFSALSKLDKDDFDSIQKTQHYAFLISSLQPNNKEISERVGLSLFFDAIPSNSSIEKQPMKAFYIETFKKTSSTSFDWNGLFSLSNQVSDQKTFNLKMTQLYIQTKLLTDIYPEITDTFLYIKIMEIAHQIDGAKLMKLFNISKFPKELYLKNVSDFSNIQKNYGWQSQFSETLQEDHLGSHFADYFWIKKYELLFTINDLLQKSPKIPINDRIFLVEEKVTFVASKIQNIEKYNPGGDLKFKNFILTHLIGGKLEQICFDMSLGLHILSSLKDKEFSLAERLCACMYTSEWKEKFEKIIQIAKAAYEGKYDEVPQDAFTQFHKSKTYSFDGFGADLSDLSDALSTYSQLWRNEIAKIL